MACTCFMQMCNDAYPLVYITILRSHIKNLLNRVENLCMDPNMSKAQNIEELKNCIKDHQNLIEFFNRISPLISVTVFIQFITSASAMAMTLINLMIFAIDFSARIASIFYFIAILTETFPLCYFAQMLMDDNNKLADTIFHSNWMGQDVAYTKMLLFFLQRSQAMMELTAGKLVPITLNSFLGSAKFSFSLYTFVKQMDTKGKFGVH
ncbi:odorant receptor 7a-like [Teleopsis dalmanni]|uniref:odorant receptor 7a-like n=1 Tax=Teleopsis dalmanni TaxID=139649 RepID=UPI0018CE7253|nr:odorant receptor 7a-like [Teleopsis dalmanni]